MPLLFIALGGACNLNFAWAQDTRDAEIFGEPAATAESSPPPQAPISAGLPSLLDTLQVGGRAELRASTAQEEKQKISDAAFEQLKTADLYFDARPNEDIRAFLRFRLSESTGGRPPAGRVAGMGAQQEASRQDLRTELDELWFKWNVADSLFFTVGKQHLKWGSGRFWNPTDFTASETRDPFALFDRRLGQTLVKMHFPVEKQGFNYYAIAQLNDVNKNEDVGGALRGEFAFLGAGELALSFQTRRAQPLKFGVDVSSAVGPVDVHVETAVSRGQKRTFYRGTLDPATGRLPEAYSAEKRWFTQSVVGIDKTWQYSDEDSFSLGAEYLFNELGYQDKELEIYAFLLGQSKPLHAGRHYAAAYVRVPGPSSWNKTSFFLNSVQNISDATNVTRLTATWMLFNELTLEAYGSRCFGDAGELCFRLPAEYATAANAPGVPSDQRNALAALPTRRTLVTAGLGASVEF